MGEMRTLSALVDTNIVTILNTLVEAFYLCDIDGNLLYINHVAEKLDGITFDKIYKKSTFEVYGLDATSSPMLIALSTEKPVVDYVFRYNINGREITQVCNAAPIYEDGCLVGAYTLQRDVTNVKEIIERNISLQQQLFNSKKEGEVLPLSAADELSQLIGEDPKFLQCKHMVTRAGNTDSSVMITGNTGSGKEVFARCIHNCSSRKKGPFLAINCAAIPESLLEGILFGTSKGVYTGATEREGLFEQASGGTIFLDEINSMPLSSQAKLLRVLEEKTVRHLGSKEAIDIDVRIISSSNQNYLEAIETKRIREDLFYRLAVINIMIPPLADRRGDIFLLANHFIARYNEQFHKNIMGLDDEALSFFLRFQWPGNVRQLKHSLEAAMNFVGENDLFIKKEHLPQYITDTSFGSVEKKYKHSIVIEKETAVAPSVGGIAEENIFGSIQEEEKREIIQGLKKCKGNVSKTAKFLHMSRQSLIYRIKKYGIK